ncbi:hypothetical protein C8R45DRAFT_1114373 [Mycena sanguinolenta]|nr:hypothetical protein C8R45DRAFT_1114373 [Mycena sanguinolenta]
MPSAARSVLLLSLFGIGIAIRRQTRTPSSPARLLRSCEGCTQSSFPIDTVDVRSLFHPSSFVPPPPSTPWTTTVFPTAAFMLWAACVPCGVFGCARASHAAAHFVFTFSLLVLSCLLMPAHLVIIQAGVHPSLLSRSPRMRTQSRSFDAALALDICDFLRLAATLCGAFVPILSFNCAPGLKTRPDHAANTSTINAVDPRFLARRLPARRFGHTANPQLPSTHPFPFPTSPTFPVFLRAPSGASTVFSATFFKFLSSSSSSSSSSSLPVPPYLSSFPAPFVLELSVPPSRSRTSFPPTLLRLVYLISRVTITSFIQCWRPRTIPSSIQFAEEYSIDDFTLRTTSFTNSFFVLRFSVIRTAYSPVAAIRLYLPRY